jgi:hypothetical protein
VQRLADERVERRAPAGPAAHLDVPEAVPGEARAVGLGRAAAQHVRVLLPPGARHVRALVPPRLRVDGGPVAAVMAAQSFTCPKVLVSTLSVPSGQSASP